MTDHILRARQSLWVQSLDETGCWIRLATSTEGRLEVLTGTGVHHLVTEYRPYVAGQARGVVITVPAFNQLFQYAVHRYVTLEVDGEDNDAGRWAVLLSGVGHELDPAVPDDRLPLNWPDALVRRQLYIPAMKLAGSVAHPCN
ncbi:hypothetical protein [Microlunatus endophyticus]|nr:hypothetical protein [Microlunatus endophyticus]